MEIESESTSTLSSIMEVESRSTSTLSSATSFPLSCDCDSIADKTCPLLGGSEVTKEFIDDMIEMFREGKKRMLAEPDVISILDGSLAIFKNEPSLVNVDLAENEKLTICGDIHGQFFDLLNIFEMNNYPKANNPYLFNGDIVDRGAFSVECILTLLCFKILYPDKFFIARGNHECEEVNDRHGFSEELKQKYPDCPSLIKKFSNVFNWLPLAHLINGKIFVVHGGLTGKKGLTLERIRKIHRGRSPPMVGEMADLLWSDPKPDPGLSPNPRGCGVLFGPDVTEDFCRRNGVELVIRSHELQTDGYSTTHDGRILTVFSAPNYCDVEGNAGAYVTLSGRNLKPRPHVFYEVEHPEATPYTS
uniref:protein-serine/threonine phosphatase n=2 Tax=Lygus hesperus TaxID=30085 RepID=A0A0K8S897_LYGHE